MTIDKITTKKIFEWCIDNLGKSRYNKGKLKLIVHSRANKQNWYGHFQCTGKITEPCTINIYLPRHNTVLELIDTVIHEYCHYKQKYPYTDNNSKKENKAVNLALKYRDKCYNELNNKQ